MELVNDDSFMPFEVIDDNTLNTTSMKLKVLHHVSPQEVIETIMKSQTESCKLDPMTVELIKDNIKTMSALIQIIVNKSFSEGVFPDDLKEALLRPLQKKLDLEVVDSNYCPVLNLTFLSKFLERLAGKRIIEHVQPRMEPHQSVNCEDHSNKTALLRVKKDLMKAINKGEDVCLVLLNLSAAFNTVDQDVLFHRLEQDYSITVTAVKQTHSYLSGRKQRAGVGDLGVDGVTSDPVTLTHGIPQGSALGPYCLLFT